MAYARTTIVDTGPAGDTIVQGVTDLDTDLTAIYTDLNTHEALTETHGATGAIVGTTNTQTLTNKTLSAPTITGAVTLSGATLTGGTYTSPTINTPTVVTPTVSGGNFTSPTITGTGTIAGVFTGNLTGNVTGNITGNITGSAGSCTGNAATATTATSATTATNLSGGTVSGTTGAFSSTLASTNPLFSATVTATVVNCTGVNNITTVYALKSNSSPACNWTEITDRATNFSGGTFTAPVTGNYLFTGAINLDGLTDNTSWTIAHLVTSNRSYILTDFNAIYRQSIGAVAFSFAIIADMDAADTAYLQIVVYDGTNAKTVDITASTYFQGYLLP